MFWNDRRDPPVGAHSRRAAKGFDPVLRLDATTSAFVEDVRAAAEERPGLELIARISGYDDVRIGTPIHDLTSVVDSGIREWRINPGRSFIRGLIDLASPTPGHRMFRTHLDQTLFLSASVRSGVMPRSEIRVAVDESGRRIDDAHDTPRLTVADSGMAIVMAFARAASLWQAVNVVRLRSGEVRPPKRLWRGIRGRNVELPDLPASAGRHHLLRSAEIVERRHARLSSVPLASVSSTTVVSTTELRRAAEFFTRNEGYVLEIDPRDVEFVSGWSLDPALAGADPATGRQEREWIVRVPDRLVLSSEAVHVHDADYAIATRDPMGIPMVYHEYECRYAMGDRHLRSRFEYNGNGVGGRVVYHLTAQERDPYGWYPRRTFRRTHGFDPVPSDPSHATSVEYVEAPRYTGRQDPLPCVSSNLGGLVHPTTIGVVPADHGDASFRMS